MLLKIIFRFVNKYLKVIGIVLVSAAAGMLLYTILNIKLEQDITKLIPKGKQNIARQFDVIDNLGLLDQLLFDISIQKGEEDTKKLISAAEQFADELEKSNLFKSIFYKINPEETQAMISKIYEKRFFLISPENFPFELLNSEEFIEQQIETLKFKLLSFESILSKEYLVKDPLGISEKSIENIFSRNVNYSVKIKNNILFSEDDKHILIITRPKKKSFDIDFTKSMLKKVNGIKSEIKGKLNYNFDIKMLGGHLYAYSTAGMIKRDITVIFIISITGIILIYLLSLGRLIPLLLSLMTIGFGIISGLFVLTLLFDSVHGITIVFGSTLIGICIDYSTHYFISYASKYRGNNSNPNFSAIHTISRSLFFGYLTTAAVFAVLFFSRLRFLQEIAVFSFTGITSAYLISVFVIPQFLFKRGIRIGFILVKCSYILKRFSSFSKRRKALVIVITALIFTCFTVLTFFSEFDEDIRSLNYTDPELKNLEREILSRYGDISTSNVIVITGDTLNEVLVKNDKVYEILSRAEKQSLIESFYNIHPFLPSIEAQKRNIKGLLALDWESIKLKVEKINKISGFKPDAFDGFFDDIRNLNKKDIPYITIDDLKDSPFFPVLDELMVNKGGSTVLLSYFKADEGAELTELIDRIQSVDKNVYYVNQINIINNIIELLKKEIIKLTLISFAVIFIILLILYKDLKKALIALLPSLFGISVAIGLIFLFGGKINIMSLFAMILIVGIGLDYGIFMLNSTAGKTDTREHTPLAIIVAAITTILSFGILIVSKNTVLTSIGKIILFGITLTMLFSVMIIPLISPGPSGKGKE